MSYAASADLRRTPERATATRVIGVAVLVYAASRPIVDTFVHARLRLAGSSTSIGQAWGIGFIALLVAYLGASLVEEGVPSLRSRNWKIAPSAFAAPVVFLAAYALLTFARADRSFASTAGARLASWVLLALVVQRIGATAQGQRYAFAAGYAAAIMIVLVISVAIALNRYGSAYYSVQYSFSTGQDPFALAAFAALALAFVAVAILAGRLVVLSWVLASLLAVCIALSFVRTTYLAALILVGTYIVLGIRRGRKTAFRMGAVLLAVALVLGVALRGTLASRFTHGNTRVSIWQPILERSFHGGVEQILTGGGAGYSSQYYLERTGIPNVWSHNDFLETFAAGGIILFVAYLLFLGWLANSVLVLYRDQRQSPLVRDTSVVCVGLFVAWVTMSFMSGVLFSVASLPFAIMLGLVRAMEGTPGATFLDLGRFPTRE
jgi:O-Antigen ligase